MKKAIYILAISSVIGCSKEESPEEVCPCETLIVFENRSERTGQTTASAKICDIEEDLQRTGEIEYTNGQKVVTWRNAEGMQQFGREQGCPQ